MIFELIHEVAFSFGFFFFQAEDGIRDHCVTGVQTCALPICPSSVSILDAGYTGPAYGIETEEGREAARLLFKTEGILLDPVYTAKAFAGLLGDRKSVV